MLRYKDAISALTELISSSEPSTNPEILFSVEEGTRGFSIRLHSPPITDPVVECLLTVQYSLPARNALRHDISFKEWHTKAYQDLDAMVAEDSYFLCHLLEEKSPELVNWVTVARASVGVDLSSKFEMALEIQFSMGIEK